MRDATGCHIAVLEVGRQSAAGPTRAIRLGEVGVEL